MPGNYPKESINLAVNQ